MYRFLAMLLVASPCFADLWRLHDSDGTWPMGKHPEQAGVTCKHYNAAGNLPWRNLGGDWVDAAGIAQGDKPFSSAPYVRELIVPQRVELDVSKLLKADGIVLRKVGDSPVTVASRESRLSPVLRLTLLDGSVVDRKPIADSSLPFLYPGVCQYTPTGKLPGILLGRTSAGVMSFGTLPSGIVKAKLILWLQTSYSPGILSLFAMTAPRLPAAMLARSAVSTIPISSDPGVYYHESWETDDWWSRNGGGQRPAFDWRQDRGRFHVRESGLWFADGSGESVPAQGTDGEVMLKRGSGYKGRGLMIAYHPTKLAVGVGVPSVIIPKVIDDRSEREPDEAWLTYRIKYGKDFFGFAGCDGGKAPGLSSVTSACANSGSPANGLCGWSLRMAYKLVCDPMNPAFGRIGLFMYAYHGLMKGWYGDAWHGNGEALLELDRWYCIEEYVKVNTPGVADGVAQFYVDGKLALDRQDVYLRAVKPRQGYGSWRRITEKNPAPIGATIVKDNFGRSFWWAGKIIDSDLGIYRGWMVVHNGGVRAPGKVAQMWLDEIKVSHRRAGCD